MSMPEANRRNTPNEPIRVYAPSRGNLAIQPERNPATRVAEPVRRPRQEPAVRPLTPGKDAVSPSHRRFAQIWREYRVTPKLAAFACVCLAAGAMLFMLRRYSRISAVQRDINSLSKEITRMEDSIEQANVSFMSSVDIGAAHDAATEAGMVYPGADSFGR